MKTFQIAQFSKYLIKSGHWRGHGVHSPFMYDFIRNTLMKASKKKSSAEYHKMLLKLSPKSISKSSFGASPSSKTIGTKRLLNKISIQKKYGKLLNSIVCSYKPQKILELGTGLGVSTFYLSNNNPASQVVSVEGMKNYSEISRKTLKSLGIENATIVNSSFEDFFESLGSNDAFDLFFIDGSHTYASTMPLFERVLSRASENAFIIFDDIRWSKDMFKSWETIVKHPRVRTSADIGRIGIVFLNPILQKQHYVIRY